MKSVLISIQPYWVFLIIARLMGWDIPQEKTIEVRKDFPKDPAWNKRVHIYCSKNRKSFNRIPKQYQPFMEKFLGRVVGEFVCDAITTLNYNTDWGVEPPQEGYFFTETPPEHVLLDFNSCLTNKELTDYGKRKPLYGWHISDLKIYDHPRELGEFYVRCGDRKIKCDGCKYKKQDSWFDPPYCEVDGYISLARPFQSWGYVEEL